MASESSQSACNAMNSTLVDSCWDKLLLCASDSPIYPLWPILQTVLLSLYFVLGLGLNGFLVFVVLWYEELRRREFALILEVVVADLMTVIGVFPVVIVTRVTGLWSLIGPSWCSFQGFVEVFSTSFRYTSRFLLAFDGLNMIFFPFVYPSRSNKVMILLSTAVLVLSLLFAIIPLGIECYGMETFNGFCTTSTTCSSACNAYRNALDSILYTAGALIPLILQMLMCLKSRKMRNRITAIGSDSLADESNKRARRTSLLLSVCLIASGVPIITALFFTPLKNSRYAKIYWTYSGMSVTLLYTVVLLDPLVIMKHQDVMKCVSKLLQTLKTELGGRMFPVTAIQATA